MHSHERTMLAKLGFADADRKEPEHDLACKYLAYEVGERVLESVLERDLKRENKVPHETIGRTEVHLVKGSGQYATTVGFADVIIARGWWHKAERQKDLWLPYRSLLIEVKVDPNPISDAIRQLKLYSSIWIPQPNATTDGRSALALATVGRVDPQSLIQLKAEHIHHIQLGLAFEDYCRREPATKDVPKSLEF